MTDYHNRSRDHYRTLELHPQASPEVIEKAYKTLSLKYHPDRNPHKLEWATARMAEINDAYSVLSDPSRRTAYDRSRVGSSGTSASGEDLLRVFWDRGLLGVAETIFREQNH